MALEVTANQAKVLVAFRRSNMAADVYNIAVELLNQRREAYEETVPASEELRMAVLDTKLTLAVLFEEEITVKE